MFRAVAATVLLVLVPCTLLPAQDSAAKKPTGTWTKSTGDVKTEFKISAHALHFTLTDGTKKFVAIADYGVSSDGVLFGRVSKVEKEGVDEGPKVGSLFSFRYAVKDGTMTVSELTSPAGDDARNVIEGDYKGGPAKKGG